MKQVTEKKVNANKVGFLAAGATFAVAVVGQAQAVLDPAIVTGLGTVQTSFNELLAAVYPIMISITVSLVVFGLVKMFINRAAR